MTSIPSLLIRPIPYADETALSFLIRAAILNGHSSVGSLLTGFASRIDHGRVIHLTTYQAQFQSTLNFLGLDPEYASLAFQLTGPTSRSARYWGTHEISQMLFHVDKQLFCPLCLREKSYWRKIWLLKPVSVCPTHQVVLQEQCPRCHKSLSALRNQINICHRCDTDISTASTQQYKFPSAINWLMDKLAHSSTLFMKEFTEYWMTLQLFCQNEELPLAHHDQLTITHEYFTNRSASITRMSAWIDQRVDSAHPKIQMSPFLTGSESLQQYAKLILEKSITPSQASRYHRNRFLTQAQVRSILGVTMTTLRYWVSLDLLHYHTPNHNVPDHCNYLSSFEVELLLLNKDNLPIKHMENIISPDPDHDSLLHIQDIATSLKVHTGIIRDLLKTRFLTTRQKLCNGIWINAVHPKELIEFNETYALTGTLARELEVNSRNLAEKFMSLGIMPISGPTVDKEKHYLFTRKSVQHISTDDIVSIKDYPTRTGRPSKQTIKVSEKSDFSSIEEAAKMLDLSINKVAVLVHKGILASDSTNKMAVMIETTSLTALINRLQNPDFVSVEIALTQLNCTINWFRQYWCKSGFLEVDDLIYWKLVSRDKLNKVLKLKENFLTGAEASAQLGMHHSHISNLQKQGVIKPHYLGHPEPIRLFKRTDVLALQESGYKNLPSTSQINQ